ncbi:hypothetical protein [Holdemania massiliensis]|uniref:hypothetical protein n=1 Tax=Holdemania massiliensis TaxID=1468449 RepID=UPI001F067E2A|nr:hypothetical protein [Holdemania massiliensis]MCH1940393.1 hypothetical protein [Holdemania massiliensis]
MEYTHCQDCGIIIIIPVSNENVIYINTPQEVRIIRDEMDDSCVRIVICPGFKKTNKYKLS